ncbi:hypothetical protein [Methylorubrum rhodesianum]|jgi:Holliday junction resolvasome RuvABC endonuclease subunit|uniref:hypothetical protein n=1 Tax=Methylorubrum rhodesianum TaxID=29427 RepID=UPI0037459EE3
MDNENAKIDEQREDMRLSDDDLEAAVGGVGQARGAVNVEASARKYAVRDPLYRPSNVKLAIEVGND